MSFPYLARSTLKYKSPHATDLSFAKGETIRVTGPSPDDEDWLVGESLDGSKTGGFPKDFVQPVDEKGQGESAASEPTAVPAPGAIPEPQTPAEEKEPAEQSSIPRDASPPPSPKPQPAELPPSSTASPAPAAPPAPMSPPAQSPAPAAGPASPAKEVDPANMSMKERLAFFAAAQNKPAPPPIKPKPAAQGGLTWSQRQKLRQEQEAKEKAEGGTSDSAAATPSGAESTSEPTAPAATSPPPASPGVADRGAMSSADAASSIGAAGSLKERMAALRNAGAFRQQQEEKPAAPKPSGKVWSRPAAPPQPEGEDDEAGEQSGSPTIERVQSPLSDQPDALDRGEEHATEAAEEEEDEEAKEKARKAAIAARMAKIGARGPMGIALPPKPVPARKPTRDSVPSEPTSPVVEKTTEIRSDDVAGEPDSAKDEAAIATSPGASSATPTSVPIAAVPRRAAPPRRRGGAPATAAKTIPAAGNEDQRVEKVHDDGTISPPPQVMVAGEENPMEKTEEQMEHERKAEEIGAGAAGAAGAAAAGIALAEHETSQEQHEEEDLDPASGSVLQPIGMVPLHSPAESGPHHEGGDDDEEDDEEAPPPPPPRMTGLPKDEVELKHDQDAQDAEEWGQEEEEEEDDVPPPVPAGRPVGGHERSRTMSSDAIPPPPPQSQRQAEPEQVDDGEVQDQAEEEEDVPPPPPSRPSVPRVPTASMSPGLPPATSQEATSPTVPRRDPIAEGDEANADTEEDEEKSRRSGIAARMAKLGGVKFGAPPPLRKQSSISSPKSEQGPASPLTGGQENVVEEPVAAPAEDDDSPEAEAARKRAILARLRGQGTLGFGMFHHGQGQESAAEPEAKTEDPRGLQDEPEEEEEGAAPPPVPSGRPGGTLQMKDADKGVEEDDDVPPPPPPLGRPSRQATRDLPPPPEEEDEGASRPRQVVRSPSVEVPPSPARSNSSRPPVPVGVDRRASQRSSTGYNSPLPPVPSETSHVRGQSGDLANEPAIMMMNQGSPASTPGVPPGTPPPTGPRPGFSPAARQQSRSSTAEVPPSPVSSRSFRMSQADQRGSTDTSGRPGFDQLQAASRDTGARLAKSAEGVFKQGKKGYYGDGSPAGFIGVAMDGAQIPRGQNWGQVVYEQEAGSILKRYDEPRAGDIAAFHDARFKGRKGLSSYEQHVGSVEDPLLGIVVDFDQKGKHKVKVLQVERGVPGEVSYRCDDLKSGRMKVYRVGL
ncbi:hypothetical protein BD324DRAFT_625771 [Kockovaella imperatae]|uniref:SH3 domain-containing protein n=1 Tax=Kockovaella imperatae TaxID=4999 RepID=A0A1Y1UIH0_9TREE|nr:hypothetical protein BD324DRAFT_625771 [Kockovaella imperatae]ORX37347.1 hypothetical protein BD324DRAFT_625771 [Kockovaella imperatae]